MQVSWKTFRILQHLRFHPTSPFLPPLSAEKMQMNTVREFVGGNTLSSLQLLLVGNFLSNSVLQ